MFIFALVLMHGMTDYAASNTLDPKVLDKVQYWFGSVIVSMLTLLWATTNGIEWGEVYDIVKPAGTIYAAVYLTFTISFLMVLLNVLTGTLVEKALQAAEPERHDLILQNRRRKHQEALEFKHMCQMMDKDQNGEISWEEFQHMMANEVFVTYMVSIGLDVNDVDLFFRTIAGGEGGDAVSLDEFVHGCMHMSGN